MFWKHFLLTISIANVALQTTLAMTPRFTKAFRPAFSKVAQSLRSFATKAEKQHTPHSSRFWAPKRVIATGLVGVGTSALIAANKEPNWIEKLQRKFAALTIDHEKIARESYLINALASDIEIDKESIDIVKSILDSSMCVNPSVENLVNLMKNNGRIATQVRWIVYGMIRDHRSYKNRNVMSSNVFFELASVNQIMALSMAQAVFRDVHSIDYSFVQAILDHPIYQNFRPHLIEQLKNKFRYWSIYSWSDEEIRSIVNTPDTRDPQTIESFTRTWNTIKEAWNGMAYQIAEANKKAGRKD
jgi:hypothetical protein